SGPRVTYTAPNPTSAAARTISPDLADVELNIFADSALSSNVWCRDLNREPRSMDENSAGGPANKMWGGRFSMSPAQIMEEINASIEFDKVLAPQDIRGSKAHAAMLAAQGIISAEDEAAIQAGLDQIMGEIESGQFTSSRSLEDVHMNIEARLKDLIGAP